MTSTFSKLHLSAGMLAILAMAACGGGGGGTSTPAPALAGPTPGPAVSQGVITAAPASALGNVNVNGVEYTLSPATTILTDGAAGTFNDLAVGKVARVKGSSDEHTRKGNAIQIEVRDALEGPIDAIDPLNPNTITVMGQLVHIEDNVTHMDGDTFTTFAASAYGVGEVVEVHGLADFNLPTFNNPTAGLRATRVDRITSSLFEVKGFISGLTPAGAPTAFNLTLYAGGPEVLTVNFLTADLPAGAVEGTLVQVLALGAPGPGGALPAITAVTPGGITLEDKLGAAGQKVEVEGIVDLGTANDFVVNGQEVLVTANTLFEGGADTDVVLGARLEAEGTLDAAGIMTATRIKFDSEIKLEGDLTAFPAGGLTLLGLNVNTNAFTRVDVSADLNLNKHIELRAVVDRNGNLLATRFDVLASSSRAVFQGPVTGVDAAAGTITILGSANVPHTFISNAATQWRTSSTATDAATTMAGFFAQVVPNSTIVKVRWNTFGLLTDPVQEAEIELGN